jgi:hypothetical protein
MPVQDQDYVDVPTPTGPMRVHRFVPKGVGPRPAVILYSEIYQVTGSTSQSKERFHFRLRTKITTSRGSIPWFMEYRGPDILPGFESSQCLRIVRPLAAKK